MRRRWARSGQSDDVDLLGLRPLLALGDLELDARPIVQRLVAVHVDRGEVDEYVLPTVDRDEAVALLAVEPLDGALCTPYSLAVPRRGRDSSNRPGRGRPADSARPDMCFGRPNRTLQEMHAHRSSPNRTVDGHDHLDLVTGAIMSITQTVPSRHGAVTALRGTVRHECAIGQCRIRRRVRPSCVEIRECGRLVDEYAAGEVAGQVDPGRQRGIECRVQHGLVGRVHGRRQGSTRADRTPEHRQRLLGGRCRDDEGDGAEPLRRDRRLILGRCAKDQRRPTTASACAGWVTATESATTTPVPRAWSIRASTSSLTIARSSPPRAPGQP